MLTPDTPISEVVQFLGPATAELLDAVPYSSQEWVLHAVKWALIGFESEGPLDPITLQETMHDFVVSILVRIGSFDE